MFPTCLCRPLGWLCFALALTLTAANPPPAIPNIDDASLLRQMPGTGISYVLPDRVFTPAFIEKLRSGGNYSKFLYLSHPQQAEMWTSIPDERWAKLILDLAPVSIGGLSGNPNNNGISPFTGKPTKGTEMTHEEFLANPFQARDKDSGAVIYAREEDMPADYPARPNHTEMIPHLDGTIHAYRFYVPEAFKDAGPEINSNRKNWYSSAGEVYRCRLKIIMGDIIPDLVAAIVLNDNDKAAHTLTVILDRIADVYPGLPLYMAFKAHGFARGRDHKNYMTAGEFRSIIPELPFIDVRDRADYPFWFTDIYDFSYLKLNWGIGGWTDGAMHQLGWVAAGFDLIRDRAGTRAWSETKYGDPGAWEARFRERCLKQMEILALANPPTTGNTSYDYIKGAVKLGIACQNVDLFRKGIALIELYMYNNWQSDGMAGDSSFAYAAMTQSGILGNAWMAKEFAGVDLAARYPLKKTIDDLGFAPVRTLYNINSKHSDLHARIYRSSSDKWNPPPDPDKLPYDTHQASFSLPVYGLTTLRAGAPGSRIELILDHLNSFQHSHYARLNYQLYTEGVECLPDFGYCVGFVAPDKKPWSEVKTGYKLLGRPELTKDTWGPWKYTYSDKPEAHNTVMVDYWQHASTPSQLLGFVGSDTITPGLIPFAEADSSGIFAGRPNPVSTFRRQVALVTLPGGNPVVIDIFRVAGGKRHDYFWHVPADTPPYPDAGTPIDAPDLSTYFGLTNYDKLTGKAIHSYGLAGHHLTKLVRHAIPTGTLASEWQIQPSRALPQPEYRQDYGDWPELLHDVTLRSWLSVSGSATTKGEIVAARGPWPGTLEISDPESGESIRGTVGLNDAVDYRIITRESEQPGLESTFAQVLEPLSAGRQAGLAEVAITPVSSLGEGGGVVCRLAPDTGAAGFVASTLGGGVIDTPEIALTGRFGAAFPGETPQLNLYDGTHLRSAGWQVDLQPSWEMTLTGLDGDLTGHPERSTLIVKSTTPLPTDDTLKGKFIYVWHQVNHSLQTVYTIDNISDLGDDSWRIDLSGRPPFILQRSTVLKIDEKDPRQMEQAFQFHLITGKLFTAGRRIRFPRTGFESAMVENGRSAFTIADAPPEGAVAKGEPFIVYTILPGDRVTIPNFFRATGARDETGAWRLDITASSPFTITAPGQITQEVPVSKLTNGSCTTIIKGK